MRSPRKEFVYWNDDGQLVAIRVFDWKAVFLEQDNKGIGVWSGQFTDLRIPKLFNLRVPSVRARRRIDPLQQVDGGSRLRPGAYAGVGHTMAAELQGVSGAAEARELQPRRGDGEAGEGRIQRRLTLLSTSVFSQSVRDRTRKLGRIALASVVGT